MELGILRPGDIQLKPTSSSSSSSSSSPFSPRMSSNNSRCSSPSPMSSPSYERNTNREQIKEELYATIKQLANKCILDTSFKSIQASAIATAIVYYARKTCNIYPVWHEDLSHMTFHDPTVSRSTLRALDLIFEMHKVQDSEDGETEVIEREDSFASSTTESVTKDSSVEDMEESMSKLDLNNNNKNMPTPTKENQNGNTVSLQSLSTPDMVKEKGATGNNPTPVSITGFFRDEIHQE